MAASYSHSTILTSRLPGVEVIFLPKPHSTDIVCAYTFSKSCPRVFVYEIERASDQKRAYDVKRTHSFDVPSVTLTVVAYKLHHYCITGDGPYRFPSQSAKSRFQDGVTALDDSHLVHKQSHVCAATVCDAGIILCSLENQDRWRLSVIFLTDLTSSQILADFTTPVCPSWNMSEPGLGTRSVDVDPFSSDRVKETSSRFHPVLLCVSTKPSSSSKPFPSLEKQLFVCLFGSQAALLDATVTVFGLPDGRVLYWPLKELSPPTHCRNQQGLRIVCDLDQPVASIAVGQVQFHDEDVCNCLVVVGVFGKVIVVTDADGTCRFNMFHVSSPVQACVVSGQKMFYISTNGQLHATILKLKKDNEATMPVCWEAKTDPLPFRNLRSIYLYATSNTGDPESLGLVTLEGCISVISLSDLSHKSPLCCNQSTNQQDLLQAIYTCSETLLHIQHSLAAQRKLLVQVGIAARLMLQSRVSATCHVQPIGETMGSYWLMVKFDNLADLCPEWWSLTVTVAEVVSSGKPSIGKSQPLTAGGTIQLAIPIGIHNVQTILNPPLEVFSSLVFMAGEESMGMCPSLQRLLPISIPISRLVLDELNFAMPAGQFPQEPARSSCGALLKEMALCRHRSIDIQNSKGSAGRMKMEMPQQRTITVLSLPLAKSLAMEEQINSSELCQKVISLLLKNNTESLLDSGITCFNHRVNLNITQSEDLVTICVDSKNPVILCRIQRAIVGRLQAALVKAQPMQTDVLVSKEVYACAQNLLSKLNIMNTADWTIVAEIYQELRCLSAALPLLWQLKVIEIRCLLT